MRNRRGASKLADVGQLGLEGNLGFNQLEPERFDPHLPLVVDQAFAGKLGSLGVLSVGHSLFEFDIRAFKEVTV